MYEWDERARGVDGVGAGRAGVRAYWRNLRFGSEVLSFNQLKRSRANVSEKTAGVVSRADAVDLLRGVVRCGSGVGGYVRHGVQDRYRRRSDGAGAAFPVGDRDYDHPGSCGEVHASGLEVKGASMRAIVLWALMVCGAGALAPVSVFAQISGYPGLKLPDLPKESGCRSDRECEGGKRCWRADQWSAWSCVVPVRRKRSVGRVARVESGAAVVRGPSGSAGACVGVRGMLAPAGDELCVGGCVVSRMPRLPVVRGGAFVPREGYFSGGLCAR